MADISGALNQTVRCRPRLYRPDGTPQTDSFGKAAFRPEETVPARHVERQQLVRNATGQEVMSSAEVLMEREPKLGDLIEGKPVMSRSNIVQKDGEVIGWNAYL